MRYAHIGPHPISPAANGTVAPGDKVELSEDEAAPFVLLGVLVAYPEPPSKSSRSEPAEASAKEK